MFKTLSDTLHNMPNPLCRVKKRLPRYILMTSCTGLLGFIVAWALLRAGVSPLASLVASAMASGLFNYAVMELWVFPHRKGRLSWSRLSENALVGVGGFSARYIVLTLALRNLYFPAPFDTLVPLALAYLASFAIGYLLRSRLVFR